MAHERTDSLVAVFLMLETDPDCTDSLCSATEND